IILNLFLEHNIEKETLVERNDKEIKERFINEIIKKSLGFSYVEDGARNELGEFVHIGNNKLQNEKKYGFNCSGFVKDVVDNYIKYKLNDFKWLPIAELTVKRTEERKVTTYSFYENQLDPYFGLDWTKNLIDKINSLCGYTEENAEIYKSDKYSNIYENGEYDFSDLKEVLFRAQQSDSKYFYILVFNKFKVSPPSIPSFYHMAIAVPYFKNNHFYIRVFESGEETSFLNLSKIHSNEKVAIFRVPIPNF
ncbi:MAG TPA: hypothetical protein PK771_05515, partial [Spirochaetota bacterium]|nr:hypothetical protein [Spirochaetota bacterium]